MPPVSFPVKLWNLLNSCSNQLMRWSDDGTEVLVNEERFEDLIDHYPSFLRQPTRSSCRRLFSIYEFRTEDRDWRTKTGWIRYSHPYFVRGELDLLELFVLSHQTRRYNARNPRPDTDDRELQKTVHDSTEDDTRRSGNVSDDDLQPISPSSLFQCTLAAGLDVDSPSATEQPPTTTNGQRRQKRGEHSSADCSMITEMELPYVAYDSEVSFCSQEIPRDNLETWMSHMNEDEEWFGLNDQPLAVPVCCDYGQHDVVDYAALHYANLQKMQHYDDMHYH